MTDFWNTDEEREDQLEGERVDNEIKEARYERNDAVHPAMRGLVNGISSAPTFESAMSDLVCAMNNMKRVSITDPRQLERLRLCVSELDAVAVRAAGRMTGPMQVNAFEGAKDNVSY